MKISFVSLIYLDVSVSLATVVDCGTTSIQNYRIKMIN